MKRPFCLNVVLVRSLYETNVGASSRAMANMGAGNLILIAPQCEITFTGHQAAARGQKPLENRRVYSTWKDFFSSEPDGLRIAFSARDGKSRLTEDINVVLGQLKNQDSPFAQKGTEVLPVYLIFGPEDWGLAAEDLELAHFCCSIPTYGDNSSLNLAQAVLLALYIVRANWGGQTKSIEVRGKESRFHSREDLFPEESLQKFLLAMGFSLQKKKLNVYTVFRRMLLRTVPTQKELRMLKIIFEQGARKMKPGVRALCETKDPQGSGSVDSP